MKKLLAFLGLMLILTLTSCETFDNAPKIKWISGSSLNYTYSGGVLSGFIANIKFTVTSDFGGEIKMTARNSDGNKSCTGIVKPGENYSVRVVFSISSSGSKGVTTIDSPSASEPFKVSSEYKVNLGSIKIN